MSVDQKKTFYDFHDADVNRYEKQMKEWKQKGFYLLDDGTKSTEFALPKKKKMKADSKPDKNFKLGRLINAKEDAAPKDVEEDVPSIEPQE